MRHLLYLYQFLQTVLLRLKTCSRHFYEHLFFKPFSIHSLAHNTYYIPIDGFILPINNRFRNVIVEKEQIEETRNGVYMINWQIDTEELVKQMDSWILWLKCLLYLKFGWIKGYTNRHVGESIISTCSITMNLEWHLSSSTTQ